MVWENLTFLVLGIGLLGVLLYWEFVIVEGAHFGARTVVQIYDWTAHRYEGIKQFDRGFEDDYLGYPLTEALVTIPEPVVLDVAAGTGRLARTVLRQPAFDGRVVCVDLSWGMLREARRFVRHWPDTTDLVSSPADTLPFAGERFDAVACLESLEFMPDPHAVLVECVRVLRPGGLLLVSNRVGREARWIFGKTYSRSAFRKLLAEFPLEDVYVQPWQVDYDLAWARKA